MISPHVFKRVCEDEKTSKQPNHNRVNGESFRHAAFCERFLNLSIRFLYKNIHRENRESVILIVTLRRPSFFPFSFDDEKEKEKSTTGSPILVIYYKT